MEGNVLDSVSMFGVVSSEFFLTNRVEWGFKNKDYLTIFHGMYGKFSVSGFETLVCKVIETKPGAIVTGSLLGISHPECHMIKAVEDSNLRSHSWFLVVHLFFFLIL